MTLTNPKINATRAAKGKQANKPTSQPATSQASHRAKNGRETAERWYTELGVKLYTMSGDGIKGCGERQLTIDIQTRMNAVLLLLNQVYLKLKTSA